MSSVERAAVPIWARALVGLGAALWIGCSVSQTPGESGFAGHSVERFESVEELLAFGDKGVVPVQVKFVLPRFDEQSPGRAHLLDPNFYQLHDEWYWFHLLNGQEIEGVDEAPVEDLSFDTIEEIYARYSDVPRAELPLDLKWVSDGTRLYSPRFYELGLWDVPRQLGLGSILHYPANPDRVAPGDLWLFELEYSDASSGAPLSPAMVNRFFTRIEATLPESLRPELRWLLRSQEQREVAESMAAQGDPLGSRVLTYADLVVTGEVQVYNPGIAAGYVRRFEAGTLTTASLRSNHVVLLEEVPDYLPPVAAILTAVPQTPLAHLNLLAASRGTPNAHVAGLMEIEGPEDWQTWKTPTLVRAQDQDVVLQPLAKEDFETYQELKGVGAYTIPVAELEGAPALIDLREGSLTDLSSLVPLTGGKAAGMMALHAAPEIPTPHAPMAVTVRPYVEHLAPLQSWIDALLSDPDFEEDGRVRFLVLEGPEGFLEENANNEESAAWMVDWLTNDASAPLADAIALGGLKRVVRDQPLNPGFEADLRAFVEEQYDALAPSQGLRFRSSSTAEDAPGFNGAGLYDSNTGYRDPSMQEESLQNRTLGWALLKTWASYWGYEAFEERRLAGMNHHEGRMAVLIHPRFDDDLEEANGVIAFQLAREAAGDRRTLVVNTQKGSLSVTNPDPNQPALPEIVAVSAQGSQPLQLDRVQPSSEVSEGTELLSDDELVWLFERVDDLAYDWLDSQNAALPAERARSTVQLDLEFKIMANGWPAGLPDGGSQGLVLKQVRTLDRAPPSAEAIAALPVPADILEQAHIIRERRCMGERLEVRVVEVTTDPAVTWCLPYDELPFDARFVLSFPSGLSAANLEPGATIELTHRDVLASHPSAIDEGAWDLVLVPLNPETTASGVERLEVETSGAWKLQHEGGQETGSMTCEHVELLLSPEAFLETLIDAPVPEP